MESCINFLHLTLKLLLIILTSSPASAVYVSQCLACHEGDSPIKIIENNMTIIFTKCLDRRPKPDVLSSCPTDPGIDGCFRLRILNPETNTVEWGLKGCFEPGKDWSCSKKKAKETYESEKWECYRVRMGDCTGEQVSIGRNITIKRSGKGLLRGDMAYAKDMEEVNEADLRMIPEEDYIAETCICRDFNCLANNPPEVWDAGSRAYLTMWTFIGCSLSTLRSLLSMY